LGCTDAELSILIVDDPHIAELNQTYLNRKGPTNVIAFPLREGRFTEFSSGMLGDVVVSVDTAAREGEIADTSMAERFDELLVHGILHLVGYDHENDEEEALEMQMKSDHIMGLIATSRNT
jgi:probable rRNA maturation factor